MSVYVRACVYVRRALAIHRRGKLRGDKRIPTVRRLSAPKSRRRVPTRRYDRNPARIHVTESRRLRSTGTIQSIRQLPCGFVKKISVRQITRVSAAVAEEPRDVAVTLLSTKVDARCDKLAAVDPS